ncbi:quaternary ammonium compound-resistance protein SugE [Rhodobacter sp. 140A]|uniref:Quaternary ammonium compound-resistance protein SugE n=1 Tax=bioreactor metagenome TaxID=1076179 RepID=A0A644TW44_9ZZZZ|nr:quaternary ammonium compound-resistance protein SugE [Rhodobacter sp. 140A]
MNPWLTLAIAGLLEVVWAVGLKYSEGFTRLVPSVVTVVTVVVSFLLLANAMRALPVGTAYAVWSGIGALGTMIYAAMFFTEPLNLMHGLGVVLIVAGIAALKIA